MDELSTGQLIGLAIPLVLVEIGLMGFALYDLIRRRKVRGGNKVLWGLVIILINYIGPVVYFVLGRGEE